MDQDTKGNPGYTYPHPPPSYDASNNAAPTPQYGFNHPGPNVVHAGPHVLHAGPTVIQPGYTVYPGAGPRVVGTAIVVGSGVGPMPTHITCRSCNHQIVTRVEHTPSTKTHLIAGLMCLIGCWPCCLIPYCAPSCMSAEHYCPNCNAYLGAYN